MDTTTGTRATRVAPGRSWHPGGWSRRRRVASAAVLALVLVGAGLFAWRASSAPLQLELGAEQCDGAPGDGDALFGVAATPDLSGTAPITIVGVDATASAATPTKFWVVPVAGTELLGAGDTDDPPPHWDERVPAAGATLRASVPAQLVVELNPHDGYALLTSIAVTYRTHDGFLHVAAGHTLLEVDATGRCPATTVHP